MGAGSLHIEFLVEGPSDEIVLREVVPRVLSRDVSFEVRPFGSKQRLLTRLPGHLRAYAASGWPGLRVCVLVDEDREDCIGLKRRLLAAVRQAGLGPRSSSQAEVLSRIAVEEIEVWFFGDAEALHSAYPRVSEHLGHKAPYRDADAIRGGTWEQLGRVLRSAGYHTAGFNKIQAARDIAPHLNPERNSSSSFRMFATGLRRLAGVG